MRSIRVVVVNMRGMMSEIVSDILRSQPDIDVTEGVSGDWVAAAREGEPDVVILEHPDRPHVTAVEPMLAVRPKLKVLAITNQGRMSFLYELRPYVLALGQLSRAALIDAVRGSAAPQEPSPR